MASLLVMREEEEEDVVSSLQCYSPIQNVDGSDLAQELLVLNVGQVDHLHDGVPACSAVKLLDSAQHR